MYLLEDLIEQIPEYKTKDLMREVYSSYTNENYRSAVVMLWNVVICDMIYKLEMLKDAYGDKQATKILEEIKEMQDKNPNSPEWEKELLKKIKDKTSFLNKDEFNDLEYLQGKRHIFAHPILKNGSELLKPNKETVRALIKNTLEAILIKTPLLSKEFINIFTNDIEKNTMLHNNYDAMSQYIENKYCKFIPKDRFMELMKVLWKMVINPTTEQEITNQSSNYLCLKFILDKYKKETILYMTEHENKFTNYECNSKEYYIRLLIINPKIYTKVLKEQTKILLKAETFQIASFIRAYFLFDNIESHLQKIIERSNEMNNDKEAEGFRLSFYYLYNYMKEIDKENIFNEMLITIYTNSSSFGVANTLFLSIKDFIYCFDKSCLRALIEKALCNDQIISSHKWNENKGEIIDKFIELGGKVKDFDKNIQKKLKILDSQ